MLYRISLGPQRIAPWIRRQAAKAVETGVDTVVLFWLLSKSKVAKVNGW